MARFYTYEELRERLPKKEDVALTRDAVIDFLADHPARLEGYAAVYGSSIWGIRDKTAYSRRSDVDVALFGDSWGPGDPTGGALTEFCLGLEKKTGIHISVIPQDIFDPNFNSWDYCDPRYDDFFDGENVLTDFSQEIPISPSLVDHFKLLAKAFPNGPHGKLPYKEVIPRLRGETEGRMEDLNSYIMHVAHVISDMNRNFISGLQYGWYDCSNPGLLLDLSKLESFPYSVARKILGVFNKVPSPDTKQNIKSVIKTVRHQGIQTRLVPLLEDVFSYQHGYDALMEQVVSGLSSDAYYERIKQIADAYLERSFPIFELLGFTREFVDPLSPASLSYSVDAPPASKLEELLRIVPEQNPQQLEFKQP